MSTARLTPAELAEHLADERTNVRRLVLSLRRTVLKAAPAASEAVKFHCLCYYHAHAPFKAIGGNICLIECRRGAVCLSFIQGAGLADPDGLLQGRATAKRRVPILDQAAAKDSRIASLIRRAAAEGANRLRSRAAAQAKRTQKA